MSIPFLVFGKRVTKVTPCHKKSVEVKPVVKPKALPVIQVIPINKPIVIEIKKIEPVSEVPAKIIPVETEKTDGRKNRKKKDDAQKV